ncbi:MAG TPA: hypothetical protein VGJ82_06715, partial [Thermoanaerobaculia bacterium]
SDGSAYLAAATTSLGVYTQLLDHNGQPSGEPNLVVSSLFVSSATVASNGHGYLLVSFDTQNVMTWLRLDSAGRPAGLRHREPSILGQSAQVVTTNDGAYHVLLQYGSGITDVTIDESDQVVVHERLASTGFYAFSVVSMGDRFALAWIGSYDKLGVSVQVQILGAVDQPIGFIHEIVFPFPGNVSSVPRIAFDGSKLLITFNVYGVLANDAGAPIDSRFFTIVDNATLQFAAGHGKTALVWSATPSEIGLIRSDAFARVVRSFDELASSSLPSTRLSNAPEIQRSPVTALLGGRPLTVWVGGDTGGSIEASIDGGATLTIAPSMFEVSQYQPEVAVAGDTALIVWLRTGSTGTQVLACRVSADGKRLDDSPIVLADGSAGQKAFAFAGIDVASDGETFVAAWPDESGLEAKRVSTGGAVVDSSPITVSRPPAGTTGLVHPRVLWTGSSFVFLFNLQKLLPGGYSTSGIAAARITRSGVPIDPANPTLLYNEPRDVAKLAAAATGSRVVAAWVESDGINTMEFSADTLTAQPARVIAPPTTTFGRLSIAARGDTFVVASSWQVGFLEEVRAMILDQDDWVVVGAVDSFDVEVTPAPAGFTFTYARIDSAAANVAQLFTRDLLLRQRAVR